MPVPDTLSSIIDDLRAMTPRARRSVLRSLTRAEREILATHLEQGPVAEESPPQASELFSPWLATSIHRARSDTSDGIAIGGMTSATRQILLRSVEAIEGPRHPEGRTATGAGRSLFDAVNGMLSPRKSRP